eukprot:3358567-Prymnesium_polylepis.1
MSLALQSGEREDVSQVGPRFQIEHTLRTAHCTATGTSCASKTLTKLKRVGSSPTLLESQTKKRLFGTKRVPINGAALCAARRDAPLQRD